MLKIQFVLTSAASQAALSVPCSCALDVYCVFPSWEMTENKSSNFFTWILPTLRKCNVIKQNHLQMVKQAVQPSAIKAMMCLLNKVCFSKPYEILLLAINLVAPCKNWKHFWTSKEFSDAESSKYVIHFNTLCLHEQQPLCAGGTGLVSWREMELRMSWRVSI